MNQNGQNVDWCLSIDPKLYNQSLLQSHPNMFSQHSNSTVCTSAIAQAVSASQLVASQFKLFLAIFIPTFDSLRSVYLPSSTSLLGIS